MAIANRLKIPLIGVSLLVAMCGLAILLPARVVTMSTRYMSQERSLPQDGLYNELSHLRMCREILARTEEGADLSSFSPVEIMEGREVCRDEKQPYNSLLTIFSSVLLSEVSKTNNLGVTYSSNCRKYTKSCTSEHVTIQEELPFPLNVNPSEEEMISMDAVRDLCQGCLSELDDTGSASAKCIFFPTQQINGPRASSWVSLRRDFVIKTMLPWIKVNLQQVSNDWYNRVYKSKLNFFLRPAKYFYSRGNSEEEAAVIYLSCREECDFDRAGEDDESCTCEDYAIPKHIYEVDIPLSATNINILMSPPCAASESCRQHSALLLEHLKDTHPRSYVTEDEVKSTSSAYVRMMLSRHLICPASESCLIPAMVSDGHALVVEDDDLFPWLKSLTCEFISKIHLVSGALKRLSSEPDLEAFMNLPPESKSMCRFFRGRQGSWAQDMSIAPYLQYSSELNHYFGTPQKLFEPTPETPFREPTTYAWTEDSYPACAVSLTNRENMCTLLSKMGMGRIFFLGDYTTFSQAVSLWKVLDQSTEPFNTEDTNWEGTVECPNVPGYSFLVQYVRNDMMIENNLPVSPNEKNCAPGWCYPWTEKYQQFAGKSVVVANYGLMNGKDQAKFRRTFHNFVGTFEGYNRVDDIVLFRTTVPGHRDCLKPKIAPYAGPENACSAATNMHDWDQMPNLNDYATRTLGTRNEIRNMCVSGLKKQRFEVLDVYPKTSLRPDGHIKSVGDVLAEDCLYYALPGPTDWWNHALFSHLEDISLEEEGV